MITNFKIFENSEAEIVEEGRYLSLGKLDNGDLKIILTPDGREEIEDVGEVNFDDLFEDIRANSEYLYWESISDAELGMMSDAPCITDGYYFEDNGDLTDDGHDDSELFYYPNYMIRDFKEVLVEDGYVIFVTNSPRSPEEIEKIRFERKVKKYNI